MKIARTVRRLIEAIPDELRVRGWQLIYSVQNRLLSKLGRAAFSRNGHLRSLNLTDDQLRLDFWAKREKRWFVDSERLNQVHLFFDQHGDERERVLGLAASVVMGQMPIFSRPPTEFLGRDRWHRDAYLYVTAPRKCYASIDYLDAGEVGDSKFVWEPNRFAWAYWLGTAYRLTDDSRYAEAFCELIVDWFRENPYPIGINYCSALEVGFRSYACIWALDLFHEYLLTHHPELIAQLVQGIWISCRHVERNLSHYFSPNTHLTGEAFCLYAAGAAIPEFSEAKRWRELGLRLLEQEAGRQFHDDGMHRELSTCYQLYSTDFYVQATLIGQHTGFAVPSSIRETALRSAQKLAELVPADGHLPQANDMDGGRLTWFCPHNLDARPTLAAAATLGAVAGVNPQESSGYHLWMRQPGLSQMVELPPAHASTPCRLPDSGFVTHQTVAGDYLLFRSGPFGYQGCPHSHDAATSLTLYLAKLPVVVDNGVGAYTQSIETRDSYRLAPGKNILLLENRGPSESDGWFSWRRKTSAVLEKVDIDRDVFYCKGRHHGYGARFGFMVEVIREVWHLRQGITVIADHWNAASPVPGSIRWTLHPRWYPCDSALRDTDQNVVHYRVFAEAELRKTPEIQEVPYSENYGSLGTTRGIVVDFGEHSQNRVVTVFSRKGRITDLVGTNEFAVDDDNQKTIITLGDKVKIDVALSD